jgi:dipeptidase
MNEHQVIVAETTFDGRPELENTKEGLHYWPLMGIVLQRSRTAREAIQVMTTLVETYGYASSGESFSIGDPKEAWLLEMIGRGPGNKGALWVAQRIPDGMVCAHANKARIGAFPLDDPENCLHSKDIVDFAVKRGFYDPRRDGAFRFCEAYCPATAQKLRYTESRVWSLFRRMAPGLDLPLDYCRGTQGARPYPLWIRPEAKVDVKGAMALMRDHYEGTPLDMTQGPDAGPSCVAGP